VDGLAAALVLGLVQGLTEFLPISSSGHLVLGAHLLGYHPPGLALEAAVHLATLGAIGGHYRASLVRSLVREPGLWGRVGVAFAVTAGLGLLLRPHVEAGFSSLWMTGGGWLLTGIALAAAQAGVWRRGRRETLPWWGAVVVGLGQGLALFPGVSRSGMTIAAALGVGLMPREAARFSFFLAIPTIGAATLYQLAREAFAPHALMAPAEHLLGASLVAGGVGWLSLRWTIRWLEERRLWLFGAYCVAAGGATLTLAYLGG